MVTLLLVMCILHIVCDTRCTGFKILNNDDDVDEQWLEDTNYNTDYIGDEGVNMYKPALDICPPVPDTLPRNACRQTKCEADNDCRRASQKCCYNGCIFTCLPELDPPAYVDWIREPKRRLRSGLSWLVSGPNTVREVEPCSTAAVEEDEDPLLCPHGYVCLIDRPKRKGSDPTNYGHCVKETDDKGTKRSRSDTGHKTSRACYLDNGLYAVLNGARINFKGKLCYCHKGKMNCTDVK